MWHFGYVDRSVISTLEHLRPAIKRRWDSLLRARPVSSPLANPDILVYLMDQTLNQLANALETHSFRAWLKRNPVIVAPLQSSCTCQNNPLLDYYRTGEQALRETAGKDLGPSMSEVDLFYHGLAQRELEALSGACCQRSETPGQAKDPVSTTTSSGS